MYNLGKENSDENEMFLKYDCKLFLFIDKEANNGTPQAFL